MTAALARLAANPSELDVLDDPAERMIQVCTRAKEWLALALDSDDIEQIAEVKSQAEALRVYAIQKQYGKDAELSAQELVRRAESGMGVAIRLGQERGEIRARGERIVVANQHGSAEPVDNRNSKPSPYDYASPDELHGNGAGIYHMVDGVTSEMFEEAIEEAKAERNLSRANVVRKVKAKKTPADDPRRGEVISEMAATGHNSKQIGRELGISDQRVRELARGYDIPIPADQVTNRTRRIDPNRVVNQLVLDVAAVTGGLDLVDFSALDGEHLEEWTNSFNESLRTLRKFADRLKKELDQRA